MNLIQTFILEVHSFEYFEYHGQTKVQAEKRRMTNDVLRRYLYFASGCFGRI